MAAEPVQVLVRGSAWSTAAGLEEALRIGMSRQLWVGRPCRLVRECLSRRQGNVSRIAHKPFCMHSLVPRDCVACISGCPTPFLLLRGCCLESAQFLSRRVAMSVGAPDSRARSRLGLEPLDRPTLDLQRRGSGGNGRVLQRACRGSPLVNFARRDPSFVLMRGRFHIYEGAASENKSHRHLKRSPWRFEARLEGRKLPCWVCLATWR